MDKLIRVRLLNSVQNAKEFKLLYKGSRDGFNSKIFRDNCAEKGATITLY